MGFIILDVILYNGCPSDTELVCIEQIQLLTWHICSPLGIFVWLCCKDIAIWSHLQGAAVRTQFKNAGCGKETDTWGWNDPIPEVLWVFQQFLNFFFFFFDNSCKQQLTLIRYFIGRCLLHYWVKDIRGNGGQLHLSVNLEEQKGKPTEILKWILLDTRSF